MQVLDPTTAIAPEMRQIIDGELDRIEDENDVRILFAIESGSRAWGFPSPDSDYDVRFVYARPVDWYLTIAPGRDVIERPITDELDIGGWDIKKALGLLIKPNPVMLEWLSSPIHYRWSEDLCARLTAFAQKTAFGRSCLYHYLHLGERQWAVYAENKDTVNLKKYFYMVRPAMAIRWIRMQPMTPPPMNFQELSTGVDLPDDLTGELEQLLIKKSRSKELGEGPRIPSVDAFVLDEFAWARGATGERPPPKKRLREEADALFLEIVKGQQGPGA